MHIASDVLPWKSLHKPYIVVVGFYVMKMMYTLDHIDSNGCIIYEMTLKVMENFAQTHKHHPTFYTANNMKSNKAKPLAHITPPRTCEIILSASICRTAGRVHIILWVEEKPTCFDWNLLTLVLKSYSKKCKFCMRISITVCRVRNCPEPVNFCHLLLAVCLSSRPLRQCSIHQLSFE